MGFSAKFEIVSLHFSLKFLLAIVLNKEILSLKRFKDKCEKPEDEGRDQMAKIQASDFVFTAAGV